MSASAGETWISTKEAAKVLHETEQGVRYNAKKRRLYLYRNVKGNVGQGGIKVEILLESLPEYAQKEYHNQVYGGSQIVLNTIPTSTKAQKEKGELRDLAVSEYKKYEKKMKEGGLTKKGIIRAEFIELWNKEHPDFQTTSKSLYEWQKNRKKGKSNVDRRGGQNRGQSSIPPFYREYFLSLYLQQAKPTLDFCFLETQAKARQNGDTIPGIKAFRNLVGKLPKTVIIRGREGKKAFEDKCMLTQQRDYSLLAPNDIWIADHHEWDIFVRVPDGSGGWKPIRPWGSYWIDQRTRKILSGFLRDGSPNADIVLQSFAIAVEKFGIPQKVYLDNGKDYKANDLYLNDCNNKVCDSLAKHLQLETIFAIPYNARAKEIERAFRTLESQLAKMYPSYAGRNAKERPEEYKEVEIMEMITLEEFIEQHEQFINQIYNEDAQRGDGMSNQSPNYLYNTLDYVKRIMPSNVLDFCLLRVKGIRTIQKEGITFDYTLYLNPEFQDHLGQKIIAKYNPANPDLLYIFDLDENFLFTAPKRKKYSFNPTDEDYAEANHIKKIARESALNGYKPNKEIRTTEAIGERLDILASHIKKAPVSEPKTVEVVRNPKMEENARRFNMSELERNYKDALEKQRQQEKKRQQATNERQKGYIDKFKKEMLDRAFNHTKQA